jgi:hypothetical protein
VFCILAQDYIECKELADLLSHDQEVFNSWRELKHVLGTKPAVFTQIEKQAKADLSSITKAVSDLLSDWIGQQWPTESTVSCLCDGSSVSDVGTGHSKGLRNHGFNRAAGTERIPTYFVKAF